MKSINKGLLVLIGVFMLIGTLLMFYEDIKLLFVHESSDSLSEISDVNMIFSSLFVFSYWAILILTWKQLRLWKILLICFFILCWLLSGRTVAFKYFPNGRVTTGWYYLETNEFNLCENERDYESIISKESSLEKLAFWRVKITNDSMSEIVFIGPFTWDSIMPILENKIGKYNKNSDSR